MLRAFHRIVQAGSAWCVRANPQCNPSRPPFQWCERQEAERSNFSTKLCRRGLIFHILCKSTAPLLCNILPSENVSAQGYRTLFNLPKQESNCQKWLEFPSGIPRLISHNRFSCDRHSTASCFFSLGQYRSGLSERSYNQHNSHNKDDSHHCSYLYHYLCYCFYFSIVMILLLLHIYLSVMICLSFHVKNFFAE